MARWQEKMPKWVRLPSFTFILSSSSLSKRLSEREGEAFVFDAYFACYSFAYATCAGLA
jgi:hypothetical protein